MEDMQTKAINTLLNSRLQGIFWKVNGEEMDVERINNSGFLSSGEKLLLDISASIWNQDTKINLYEVFNTLDDNSYHAFIKAISTLRTSELPPP